MQSTIEEWVPIAVETLRAIPDLPVDLYLPVGGRVFRLYRANNIAVDEADLNRLVSRGVRTLYAPGSMANAYRDHLRELVLTDSSFPLAQRYELLTNAARTVFEDAFLRRDVAAISAASNELGSQLVELVTKEDFVIFDLVAVMLHDFSTYAHSTRVCMNALAIAKCIGITSQEELSGIATGGLLHDVGKLFLSESIIIKNYRVKPRERDQLRAHPTQGFRRLAGRDDLSWGTLMMVYQHHERVDGSGYPVGVSMDEIHLWARICSLANTCDALHQDYPPTHPFSTQEMLRSLSLQSGRALDEELTECWMDQLKTKPLQN